MIKLSNQVYRIEPSLPLLYGVAYGKVEARDIMRNQLLIWQDPLRQPNMKIIFDGTLVSALSFERTDFQEQIDLNNWMLAQGHLLEPTAIIGRKNFDLVMGKMIDMQVQMAVPIRMGTFLTLREAVDWLELGHAYEQIAQLQRDLQVQAVKLRGTLT